MRCRNCGGRLEYYSLDGVRRGELTHTISAMVDNVRNRKVCNSPELNEVDNVTQILKRYEDD